MASSKQPPAEDVISCQTAMFEWAERYDTKDWNRFLANAAPTLLIDYRLLMDRYWEAIPSSKFIEMVKDPGFLGNPRVKSQHFVGVSRFVQESEDYIIGTHQMRVTHQRYKDDELTEVQRRGHASGNCTVHYKRIEGVWKWAGLLPGIRWKEHEFDKTVQVKSGCSSQDSQVKGKAPCCVMR